jgi:hypothetical protein
LACDGNCFTFPGEKAVEGIATVNWLEIYALFGAPVVALALGIFVYFIASRSHSVAEK